MSFFWLRFSRLSMNFIIWRPGSLLTMAFITAFVGLLMGSGLKYLRVSFSIPNFRPNLNQNESSSSNKAVMTSYTSRWSDNVWMVLLSAVIKTTFSQEGYRQIRQVSRQKYQLFHTEPQHHCFLRLPILILPNTFLKELSLW